MRYVINTSAAPEHTGGNEKLATSGAVRRGGGLRLRRRRPDLGAKASIVAHESVLAG